MTTALTAKEREKLIRTRFLRVKQLAQQDYRTRALTNAKGFELLRGILDIQKMLRLLQPTSARSCQLRRQIDGFLVRRAAGIMQQLRTRGADNRSGHADSQSVGSGRAILGSTARRVVLRSSMRSRLTVTRDAHSDGTRSHLTKSLEPTARRCEVHI